MRILLIDGDEAVRLGSAEILAMCGLKADVAANGKEASRIIASGRTYEIVCTSEDFDAPAGFSVKRLKKPYTAQELINAVKEGGGF